MPRRPISVARRIDRKGTVTDLNLPKGNDRGLRISPDGHRLAVTRNPETSRLSDIWAYDLARGVATRVTAQGENAWPLWTLDGKRILFRGGPGTAQILSIMADGQGSIETFANGKPGITPSSWSPDGKWLAYLESGKIWVRSASGQGEARLFLESKFELRDAQLSPNGKWMAYSSDESGTYEVCVQAFPGPGEKHRISTDGGSNPAWARNGRELFYWKDRSMMAVDIAAGEPFHAGTPRKLFEVGWATLSLPLRSYDVYPDGQSFILARPDELPDLRATRLNVVLNWFDELKRRAPRSGQ
jgi:Tol biopolymer transport system component